MAFSRMMPNLATRKAITGRRRASTGWRPPSALFGLAVFVLVLLGAARLSASPAANGFLVTDLGHDTLVFYRARSNAPGFEGFVVDSASLVGTLKARVLEARGLGEVAQVGESRGGIGGKPSPGPAHPYSFSHAFEAPFDSVKTSLTLRPLSEGDPGQWLEALAMLLAVATIAGLYALYRMTAAQVAFAERRNNFVSAVSHELKTPLTAIRMHGEMLMEGLVEDPCKQREYYRTITSESERLSRLINNVLELSRIERRRSLPLREGDVRPVLREVVGVLRPHAEHEGFGMECELAESLSPVEFEPDALRQVLFNLIDNALKYGREAEHKRITLRAEPTETGVLVTVRDRGPGVARDQLAVIFEPFFRGEPELNRKHPGSGIGLALVKGLVESMHGRVSAHTDELGFEIRVELRSR